MSKMKEKEASYALEKFNNDFEEVRKHIINHINQSLSEVKARYAAEIKEKCLVETAEEGRCRTAVDELLGVINSHLVGLKKGSFVSNQITTEST